MRPWVVRLARGLGLAGRVHNHAAGVTIDAFGELATLEELVRRLGAEHPPAAVFDEVRWAPIPVEPGAVEAGFVIVASREGEAERRFSIPPDLATCADCLAELRDPRDRRYRYPFTNCTNCGPRFSIALDVPYDRPATTMAPFSMCPDCAREYADPGDRRFHAQPNACPVCGPRLTLLRADGSGLGDSGVGAPGDPIERTAAALVQGAIVAVKGIGGFHLACDATDAAAVARLRQRKRREEKPFAIMVRDLAAAADLAELTEPERHLLEGVERPIVLARRRPAALLAEAVAPGTPLIGLMLPYTPLHHLLCEAASRPLVMTSGNLSEEPICASNDEALTRLRGIADLFLVHDRDIENRSDDSVARVIAGAPVLTRRSRGYVPRGTLLGRRLARSVLACGAQLKNTFCLAAGDTAVLGPHIGDLDNLETFEVYRRSIARLERFLKVSPEVLAHDLHPELLSTRYARERAAASSAAGGAGAPMLVPVQHHHAHVASLMAEHGLKGPMLGIAYDGTGYGPDGSAWGGELLVADYAGYERVATFRPIALAGGDRAIHDVWRLALALLDDAFAGDPPLDRLALFQPVPPRELRVVRQMISGRLNSPLAHGVGRYFDAVGALVLGLPVARHEGQVAIALESAAGDDGLGELGTARAGELAAYPFVVDRETTPWIVDLRPAVRALVEDLLAARPTAALAARFHETLAAATATVVREVLRARGPLPIGLTGGCFQNARLTVRLRRSLPGDAVLYVHSRIPPGDGGVSLGQALVADAVASAGGSAASR